MEFKRNILGIILLCGTLALAVPSPRQAKKAEVSKPEVEPIPLIRKDLLHFEEGEIGQPLRDIFRPKPSRAEGAVQPRPVAPRPAAKPAVPEEKPPEFVLDLKYIGSVQAGGKTMALVIRSGQAVPVAEGEEVIPGYRVVRITPQEIEIEGPDAQKRTFSRQGDR